MSWDVLGYGTVLWAVVTTWGLGRVRLLPFHRELFHEVHQWQALGWFSFPRDIFLVAPHPGWAAWALLTTLMTQGMSSSLCWITLEIGETKLALGRGENYTKLLPVGTRNRLSRGNASALLQWWSCCLGLCPCRYRGLRNTHARGYVCSGGMKRTNQLGCNLYSCSATDGGCQ